MKLCASCHRRPSRAADQSYCRDCYRAYRRTWTPPANGHVRMRTRAQTLLTMFVLTPRELSCALDISVYHASLTLRRLWEQGYCERWPHRDRSYRYRLRETHA